MKMQILHKASQRGFKMSQIKIKSLDLRKLSTAVKSLKANGLSFLIEFFSDDKFVLKTITPNDVCLRISEFKFADYFSKKISVLMPDYLAVVINYDTLVDYFKLFEKFSKCHWNMEYELVNGSNICKKIIMTFSNSQRGTVEKELEIKSISNFNNVLLKDKDYFLNNIELLYSFTLEPKIARKIKECDNDTLNIYLTQEELGYNVCFSDGDFILIGFFEHKIHEHEESVVSIDSQYLSLLGSESYNVNVSHDYLFFNGIKSGELIILKVS